MVRSGGTRSAAIRRSSRAGWPTAVDRDYAGSGFDRGHLLPSADRDDSRAENDATFYLVERIAPVSEAEQESVAAARGAGSPLGRPLRFDLCGDRRRAGAGTEAHPGGTGIPRHYFKALLARAEKGWRAIAFRLPNVASPEGSWTDYSLSVDRLEELTGIDFFPALPDSIERRVESRVDAGFWK